jgi:hypothetical protein
LKEELEYLDNIFGTDKHLMENYRFMYDNIDYKFCIIIIEHKETVILTKPADANTCNSIKIINEKFYDKNLYNIDTLSELFENNKIKCVTAEVCFVMG